MLPILLAGPASRKTSTVPGEMPANSKPVAIGVDAVAQTYIGMLTAIITSIATRPLPQRARKSGGSQVATAAEKSRPMQSQKRIPPSRSVKAYRIPENQCSFPLGAD